MTEPFKVVIVGGGSAGWMTAAYLSKALERDAEIRLIESPNIPTIGVGEATFSTLRLFFDFLGLDEEDWMPDCNAAYKVAIRFVNWNAEGRVFYHPFQRFEHVRGRTVADWWLKLRGSSSRFDYDCFTVPAICDAQRSPRYLDGRVFDAGVNAYLNNRAAERDSTLEELRIQYPYAYHFDAALIAKFLCQYAQKRGVQRILDEVVAVEQSEDGGIRRLRTGQHDNIEADLFIDCTGFRGVLINQVLQEPFLSFQKSLPCDRAVALQVPYESGESMNPYTQATALSAGWVWNIPLYSRIGTGYVYCSSFLSPDEAEQELRQHLGRRAEGCTANHIKIRAGRNRNSWVKNCVAIGLSSGFVEPLESTGIFFIQNAIEQLVANFPRIGNDPVAARVFNRNVSDCIDGIGEFLTLHYAAGNKRDTPFWEATKRDLYVPDGLQERLEIWKHSLPTNRTIRQGYHGFEAYSYAVMLMGLGQPPAGSSGLLEHLDSAEAVRAFEQIRNRAENMANSLPSQREYLKSRYEGRSAALSRAAT